MARAKQLTIVPDIKNNVIFAKGPDDLLERIQDTVANLDVGPGWQPPVREVLQLKYAAATTVVKTLNPIHQKEAAARNKSTSWVPQELKNALECSIFAIASSNSARR